MKMIAFLCGILIYAISTNAQKQVVSHQFQFSKANTGKSYFLQDDHTKQFILVLQDQKAADYVLFDADMKKLSNITPEGGLQNTIFRFDKEEYLGGTASNGKFHFVYMVTDKKLIGKNIYYQLETVEPGKKSITNRQLFEIPKEEKLIMSFGNFGQYYTITANNKTDELTFYGLNAAGESFIKKVPIQLPASAKKESLSEYLGNMELIKVDEQEEIGLNQAAHKEKLFHSPDYMTIVVDENDQPTQLITINTKDFTVKQKELDHSAPMNGKKSNTNSFLFDKKLYTVLLNRQSIRIAIYDQATLKLIKTHEITEETDLNSFAFAPMGMTRTGKKVSQMPFGDPKKLFRWIDRGTEGIIVTKDKNGKLLITVGTYDIAPVSSGGGGGWSRTPGISAGGGFTSTMVYKPGWSSNTSYSANNYTSVYFMLLVDPANFNLVKGSAPGSVNEQIKDYLSEIRPKAAAINQFSMNGKHYIGYYDKQGKEYLIDEIWVKK